MFNEMTQEAMQLLDDHRKRVHTKDKKDCTICRSLRRTILRGWSK